MCRRCETVCNKIQTVGALTGYGRGFSAKVGTASLIPLAESNCTFCGQCVNVCPVGAITGVSYVLSGEEGPFTGSFRVPAEGEIVIKKMDYDRDDGELEVDFNTRVDYDELSISVQDKDGKVYEAQVRERDRDGVDLRVRGLKRGEEYTVTISGLRLPDSANLVSVSGSFKA
jgi:ferredoxin